MSRILVLSLALFISSMFSAQLMAEGVREEEHPRIECSIHEREETIKFPEAAPHDFGGHREDAIKACREALRQLREALGFAARHER